MFHELVVLPEHFLVLCYFFFGLLPDFELSLLEELFHAHVRVVHF